MILQLVIAAAGALAGAAVGKELAKPSDQRTWHGDLMGIPYDFRPPTADKIQRSFWDPDNPRLFTPHAFGVGYGVNLARFVPASRPEPGEPPAAQPRR